jgi:hypothetical protein
MRRILHPGWLIAVNTAPMTIFFFILAGHFQIVHSMMSDETHALWITYGALFFLSTLSTFVYAIIMLRKQLQIHLWYGVVSLAFNVILLYTYSSHLDALFPSGAPNWMFSGGVMFYIGSFLMPTLAHAVLLLVVRLSPSEPSGKPALNLVWAALIAGAWYLFYQLVIPFWDAGNSSIMHITSMALVLTTLLFFFFLIRGIFLMMRSRTEFWPKYKIFVKIAFTLVFPIFGLLLNNGHIIFDFNGIFGDFDNHWFYLLTVFNAAVLIPDPPKAPLGRLILFLTRLATFFFTLYFLFVFLPFLPLSILAIVFFGLGFVMLAPIFLGIIHIRELSDDVTWLMTYYSRKQLLAMGLPALMVIPAAVTISYHNDRIVLNNALNYINQPDYEKSYDIDTDSLHSTLQTISSHRSNRFISSDNIPFLSSYFRWLVMDNLMLSNAKADKINRIFFGEKARLGWNGEVSGNISVGISGLDVQSEFNPQDQSWHSWVHLELTNDSTLMSAEYATRLRMPDGCWISDYYLDVGDIREPGILAEKKAATWIYNNIRNARRDPGILYYTSGNEVWFRVFPFGKGDVRKTGIRFIHKEPLALAFDDKTVQLGAIETTSTTATQSTSAGDVYYVSSDEKSRLPQMTRKPYLYILVDASQQTADSAEVIATMVNRVRTQKPAGYGDTQIGFVNSYYHETDNPDEWQSLYKGVAKEGGFFLERGIKKILFEEIVHTSASYPVIVVVSPAVENCIIERDFADFRSGFPESDYFYSTDRSGRIYSHNLTAGPKNIVREVGQFPIPQTVLAWPNRNAVTNYLRDNTKPELILKSYHGEINGRALQPKSWASGAKLQGQWTNHVLFPNAANSRWLDLVRNSFQAQLMTPVTSFIVVETEAQRAALQRKQDEVLSGNPLLDAGEDTRRMSEPGSVFLLIILMTMLLILKKRLLQLRSSQPQLKRIYSKRMSSR